MPDPKHEMARRQAEKDIVKAGVTLSTAMHSVLEWTGTYLDQAEDADYAAAMAVGAILRLADHAITAAASQMRTPDPLPTALPPSADLPDGMGPEEALREVRASQAAEQIKWLGDYRAALRREEGRVASLLREQAVMALTERVLTWSRVAELGRVSPDTLGRWMAARTEG